MEYVAAANVVFAAAKAVLILVEELQNAGTVVRRRVAVNVASEETVDFLDLGLGVGGDGLG